MIKKVLITGHNGLIGQELFKRFLDDTRYDVAGIDRGDEIPSMKFDIVIHCASNCVVRDIIDDTKLAKENVDYFQQILDKANNDYAYLYVFSSSRVGGEENPYTASKKYLEQMTEAYANCYGLMYTIIRPETVWGMQETNTRVMKTWVQKIMNDEPIIVYGDENKELPPITVYDFCDVFIKEIFEDGIKHCNKNYSISGQPHKVTDIVNDIGNFLNKEVNIIYKSPELTQPQTCRLADFVVYCPIKTQLAQMTIEEYAK